MGGRVVSSQGHIAAPTPAPDVDQAGDCFQQALDVARRQEAKALELRAAMSLSRLWQRQGKRIEATTLLAEVYSGSRRGLTPPTCKKPRRCWRSCRNATPVDTRFLPNSAGRVFVTP